MESRLLRYKAIRLATTTLLTGIAMWVVAGLYHNLVLPFLNPDVDAHHEGLEVMLYAYIILAGLMVYLYSTTAKSGNRLAKGILFGATIGVLWTFPHGLALAGIHGTSIPYEFLNSSWHMFEQGVGGMLVAILLGNKAGSREG